MNFQEIRPFIMLLKRRFVIWKRKGVFFHQQFEVGTNIINFSYLLPHDFKEEYYQSLGYKDIFEGMIGEAEKEGKGDEMRDRLAKFRLRSKVKAAAVLVVAIVGLFWVQSIYNMDPEHFLKGGLPDYSRR